MQSQPPGRWPVPADLKHAMSRSAQALRKRSTRSEDILWRALRGKQIGVKFRRQQPIANFIVDFYASDARLVIEVDGSAHIGQEKRDTERQQLLESLGLRVLRLPATDIERNLARTLEAISGALADTPIPNPSPIKGKGTGSDSPSP